MTEDNHDKGSAAHVWFAAAGSSSSETQAIWPVGIHMEDMEAENLSRTEMQQRLRQNQQMILDLNGGHLFAPEDWGTDWSPRGSIPPGKLKPFTSFGGGIYVVTRAVKDFLETRDIGEVRFHPIRVLNKARTGLLWPGTDLYHMNVGTVKRGLDLEATPANAQRQLTTLSDGAPLFSIRAIDEDDAYVFEPSVLAGPELWIDDTLSGALFVSDALANALKAAKLDQGWLLKRCGVTAN